MCFCCLVRTRVHELILISLFIGLSLWLAVALYLGSVQINVSKPAVNKRKENQVSASSIPDDHQTKVWVCCTVLRCPANVAYLGFYALFNPIDIVMPLPTLRRNSEAGSETGWHADTLGENVSSMQQIRRTLSIFAVKIATTFTQCVGAIVTTGRKVGGGGREVS